MLAEHEAPNQPRLRSGLCMRVPRLQVGQGGPWGGAPMEVRRHFQPAAAPASGGAAAAAGAAASTAAGAAVGGAAEVGSAGRERRLSPTGAETTEAETVEEAVRGLTYGGGSLVFLPPN
jgi:hypothetical protein